MKYDDLARLAADIAAEKARAEGLYPAWPTDPIHAAAIVQEECGELIRAVLQWVYEPQRGVTEAGIRTEAIQTAAMVLRFVEALDVNAYGVRR